MDVYNACGTAWGDDGTGLTQRRRAIGDPVTSSPYPNCNSCHFFTVQLNNALFLRNLSQITQFPLKNVAMTAMEALNLNLPSELAPPEEFGLDSNPESVRVWIAELPLANTHDSCEQIIQLLSELNRSKMDAFARYRHLAHILPVANKLIDVLRVSYQNAYLPLSEKNRRKFIYSISMSNELARGFRLLVKEITSAANYHNDKRLHQMLITCIYLAIEQLGLVMHEHYIAYVPIPRPIWKIINRLYLFCVKNNLELLAIPTHHSQDRKLTIAYVYKTILLLEIINPHHLMQGETSKLRQLICESAGRCELNPMTRERLAYDTYLIDLNTEQGPRLMLKGSLASSDNVYCLEINPFRNHVEKKLRQVQQDNDTKGKGKESKNDPNLNTGLSLVEEDRSENDEERSDAQRQLDLLHRLHRDMYMRVLGTISRQQERIHKRNHALGKVEMTIGLSSAHYHLSNEANFCPELDEIKIHTGKYGSMLSAMSLVPMDFEHWRSDETEKKITEGVHTPRTSVFDSESDALDTWNKIYAHKPISSDEEQQFSDLKKYNASSSWKKKNVSAGGMCVFCQPQQTMPVRVGELVAYRVDEKEAWWIGIIRWLRVHDNSTLEIGLMHLHHQAYCVATRAIKGTGSGGEYFRALMTEENIEDEYNTLILPTAVFDQNTELVANFGNRLVYLKLEQALTTTKAVTQFKYSLITTPTIELESIEKLKRLL